MHTSRSPKAEESKDGTYGFSFPSAGVTETYNYMRPDQTVKPRIAIGPAPNTCPRNKETTLNCSPHSESYVVETAMVAPQHDSGAVDGSSIIILMDSGSSEHYMATGLHPGLKERVVHHETLNMPHYIRHRGHSEGHH